MRAKLHNNIFIVAGFEDNRGIPARVIYKDSDFAEEFESILTNVLACPKCHLTTDRKGFCFNCGKFVLTKDSIRTLRRIGSDK